MKDVFESDYFNPQHLHHHHQMSPSTSLLQAQTKKHDNSTVFGRFLKLGKSKDSTNLKKKLTGSNSRGDVDAEDEFRLTTTASSPSLLHLRGAERMVHKANLRKDISRSHSWIFGSVGYGYSPPSHSPGNGGYAVPGFSAPPPPNSAYHQSPHLHRQGPTHSASFGSINEYSSVGVGLHPLPHHNSTNSMQQLPRCQSTTMMDYCCNCDYNNGYGDGNGLLLTSQPMPSPSSSRDFCHACNSSSSAALMMNPKYMKNKKLLAQEASAAESTNKKLANSVRSKLTWKSLKQAVKRPSLDSLKMQPNPVPTVLLASSTDPNWSAVPNGSANFGPSTYFSQDDVLNSTTSYFFPEKKYQQYQGGTASNYGSCTDLFSNNNGSPNNGAGHVHNNGTETLPHVTASVRVRPKRSRQTWHFPNEFGPTPNYQQDTTSNAYHSEWDLRNYVPYEQWLTVANNKGNVNTSNNSSNNGNGNSSTNSAVNDMSMSASPADAVAIGEPFDVTLVHKGNEVTPFTKETGTKGNRSGTTGSSVNGNNTTTVNVNGSISSTANSTNNHKGVIVIGGNSNGTTTTTNSSTSSPSVSSSSSSSDIYSNGGVKRFSILNNEFNAYQLIKQNLKNSKTNDEIEHMLIDDDDDQPEVEEEDNDEEESDESESGLRNSLKDENRVRIAGQGIITVSRSNSASKKSKKAGHSNQITVDSGAGVDSYSNAAPFSTFTGHNAKSDVNVIGSNGNNGSVTSTRIKTDGNGPESIITGTNNSKSSNYTTIEYENYYFGNSSNANSLSSTSTNKLSSSSSNSNMKPRPIVKNQNREQREVEVVEHEAPKNHNNNASSQRSQVAAATLQVNSNSNGSNDVKSKPYSSGGGSKYGALRRRKRSSKHGASSSSKNLLRETIYEEEDSNEESTSTNSSQSRNNSSATAAMAQAVPDENGKYTVKILVNSTSSSNNNNVTTSTSGPEYIVKPILKTNSHYASVSSGIVNEDSTSELDCYNSSSHNSDYNGNYNSCKAEKPVKSTKSTKRVQFNSEKVVIVCSTDDDDYDEYEHSAEEQNEKTDDSLEYVEEDEQQEENVGVEEVEHQQSHRHRDYDEIENEKKGRAQIHSLTGATEPLTVSSSATMTQERSTRNNNTCNQQAAKTKEVVMNAGNNYNKGKESRTSFTSSSSSVSSSRTKILIEQEEQQKEMRMAERKGKANVESHEVYNGKSSSQSHSHGSITLKAVVQNSNNDDRAKNTTNQASSSALHNNNNAKNSKNQQSNRFHTDDFKKGNKHEQEKVQVKLNHVEPDHYCLNSSKLSNYNQVNNLVSYEYDNLSSSHTSSSYGNNNEIYMNSSSHVENDPKMQYQQKYKKNQNQIVANNKRNVRMQLLKKKQEQESAGLFAQERQDENTCAEDEGKKNQRVVRTILQNGSSSGRNDMQGRRLEHDEHEQNDFKSSEELKAEQISNQQSNNSSLKEQFSKELQARILNPNSLLFNDTTRIRLNQARPSLDQTFQLNLAEPVKYGNNQAGLLMKRNGALVRPSHSFRMNTPGLTPLRPKDPPPPPPTPNAAVPVTRPQLPARPKSFPAAVAAPTSKSNNNANPNQSHYRNLQGLLNISSNNSSPNESKTSPYRTPTCKSQISLPMPMLGFSTTNSNMNYMKMQPALSNSNLTQEETISCSSKLKSSLKKSANNNSRLDDKHEADSSPMTNGNGYASSPQQHEIAQFDDNIYSDTTAAAAPLSSAQIDPQRSSSSSSINNNRANPKEEIHYASTDLFDKNGTFRHESINLEKEINDHSNAHNNINNNQRNVANKNDNSASHQQQQMMTSAAAFSSVSSSNLNKTNSTANNNRPSSLNSFNRNEDKVVGQSDKFNKSQTSTLSRSQQQQQHQQVQRNDTTAVVAGETIDEPVYDDVINNSDGQNQKNHSHSMNPNRGSNYNCNNNNSSIDKVQPCAAVTSNQPNQTSMVPAKNSLNPSYSHHKAVIEEFSLLLHSNTPPPIPPHSKSFYSHCNNGLDSSGNCNGKEDDEPIYDDNDFINVTSTGKANGPIQSNRETSNCNGSSATLTATEPVVQEEEPQIYDDVLSVVAANSFPRPAQGRDEAISEPMYDDVLAMEHTKSHQNGKHVRAEDLQDSGNESNSPPPPPLPTSGPPVHLLPKISLDLPVILSSTRTNLSPKVKDTGSNEDPSHKPALPIKPTLADSPKVSPTTTTNPINIPQKSATIKSIPSSSSLEVQRQQQKQPNQVQVHKTINADNEDDDLLDKTRSLLNELNEKLAKFSLSTSNLSFSPSSAPLSSANKSCSSSSSSPNICATTDYSTYLAKLVQSSSTSNSNNNKSTNNGSNNMNSNNSGSSSSESSSGVEEDYNSEKNYSLSADDSSTLTPNSSASSPSASLHRQQTDEETAFRLNQVSKLVNETMALARGKFMDSMKIQNERNLANNGMNSSEEPIYEEINENENGSSRNVSTPIYADAFDVKSIFDGASRNEILSFLESIRDRLAAVESSSSSASTNSLDNRKSAKSLGSALTKKNKKTKDSERNDSGIGSEAGSLLVAAALSGSSSATGTNNNSSSSTFLNICKDCQNNIPECNKNGNDLTNEMSRPGLCISCARKRNERKEIIQEIYETELKYGRDLRIISDEFYNPIQVAGLLSKEQLDQIFLNVAQLIEINIELTHLLKMEIEDAVRAVDEDLINVSIGRLFLDIGEKMMSGFESYCTRQASAGALLVQLEKEKELLRIFLRVSQMENTVLRRMNLPAFLMVPVQRVTRYPLLLSRLLKVTSLDHSSHDELQMAAEKIEQHLEHMNNTTREVASTKLWRRISIINGGGNNSPVNRRSSTSSTNSDNLENSGANARIRKMAFDVLNWTNQPDAYCIAESQLGLVLVNGKPFRNIYACLLAQGKNLDRLLERLDQDIFFPPKKDQQPMVCEIDVKDVKLILVRMKSTRYTLLREPLCLSNCIISQGDEEFQDYVEIDEISTRNTCHFKGMDKVATSEWLRLLQCYAVCVGQWRNRRGALANIMMNGMFRHL